MGSPIVVWPGADKLLAKAAQRAKVPYTLGVAGGATIEEIAEIAPDVFWMQLYRFAGNDHAIGFDVIRRADAAGAHVLMLTLDVPVRTVRSREVKVGLGGGGKFKADWRMVASMVKCPGWAVAMLQNGQPRFANIQPYAGKGASLNDTIKFARKEMGGAFSWEEVARYRDKWKKPMIVKGLLHPADAEKAVSLGIEGILVSNHGGRQIEALPPPIDCVPAVVKAVGSKATVLFDSGVRSGTDVARALALDPELLFLDEPTASLDPEGVKRFREFVLSERERGTTIVFSTHLLSEVEQLADRDAKISKLFRQCQFIVAGKDPWRSVGVEDVRLLGRRIKHADDGDARVAEVDQ